MDQPVLGAGRSKLAGDAEMRHCLDPPSKMPVWEAAGVQAQRAPGSRDVLGPPPGRGGAHLGPGQLAKRSLLDALLVTSQAYSGG